MKHKNEWNGGDTLKCIWMTAGVVDYKLCEQEYDCEHCAFDRAFRGVAPEHRPADMPGAEILNGPGDEQGYRLDGASFYHPAHLWLRIEEEGRIRVGLDDFGQKLTGRIYSVRLPQPDAAVDRDSGCWSIMHSLGETVLSGGANGKVVEVNQKLELLPSLMNSDPYGKGWAFVLEPDDLPASLKSLYYGGRVRHWVVEEVHRLRQVLDVSCAELGVTLPDGGLPLPGPESRYPSPDSRIIEMFLSARGSDPAGTGNASKFVRR
jgi:glycine cleavage system H lipoate-binding protein